MEKRIPTIITICIVFLNTMFAQEFVGFYECDPVITYDSPIGAFVVTSKLKRTKLELGKEKILLSINECGMLTTNLHRDRLELVIGNNTTIYHSSIPSGSVVGLSEDCKQFILSDSDSISILRDGKLMTKIVGSSPQLIGNYIYYHYSEVYSPGMTDLYRVPINDFGKKEMIVANVFDLGVLVFDNGNYIACTIPKNEGPQTAVYNTSSKEFKIVMNADPANFPIYFPKTKSLRYINIANNTFSEEVVYRE